jgi:hypothetical protein
MSRRTSELTGRGDTFNLCRTNQVAKEAARAPVQRFVGLPSVGRRNRFVFPFAARMTAD